MENTNSKNSSIEQKLIKSLTFLLNNKHCIDYLKNSKNFQNILKNELLILNHFLTTKKKNKEHIHILVDKYNAFCLSNKLDLKDKLSIKNEDEMIDYVNYLKVYIKNILHFDIDEAINSPSKFENIKFNNNELKLTGVTNPNGTWENIFKQNFHNINPFVLRVAQSRINEKLKNDEIFVFKSKPKIVKIIKIIYACLMFLFAFAMLFLAVVWFLIANKPTGYNYYVFGYFNPIFLVVFSMTFAYSGLINIHPYITAIKTHKKPSQNAIYSVISLFVTSSVIFGLLFSIYNIWPIPGARTIYEFINIYGDSYDEFTKTCVFLMSIAISSMIAISLLSLIAGIILITNKPKRDSNAINKLLFDEINNVINEKPIDLTPDKSKVSSQDSSSEPKD